MPVQPKELEQLVSQAVHKALQQRKISDEELRNILKGPITIGLLASPPHLSPELQKAGAEMAVPGVHDKHRLIGFVAPDIEKIDVTLKSK
jgi:hypothetical protein